MRMEVLGAQGGYTVISDCYNAAPDSMRVALELLAELPGRQKFAVLGDMKELGQLTESYHREVGRLAAGAGLAALLTVGELGREIAEGARQEQRELEVLSFDENAAAAAALLARLRPGDVALVKGSRAMEMETIVRRLVDG
jgi:UDP-N-acetylmuramoyl-tripeptide--D-alanyl-D-alanine ligase